MGEPLGRVVLALRVLQLLPDSQDIARYSRDGTGDCGSRLEHSRTAQFGLVVVARSITLRGDSVVETRSVLAYTDETGNSGMQMFDANQPYFWTGTLLTPVDWELLPSAIHQACLERARCNELHANKLGLSGIERIAGKLINLFSRYGARFLFTRIEKTHFLL